MSVINGVITNQIITGEMALTKMSNCENKAARNMPNDTAKTNPNPMIFIVKIKCGQRSVGNFRIVCQMIALGAGSIYFEIPDVRAMISKPTNSTTKTTRGARKLTIENSFFFFLLTILFELKTVASSL
jgi:hypothetical protein